MEDRKLFPNSVLRLPADHDFAATMAEPAALSDAEKGERLQLHFSLAMAPDLLKEIEDRVARGEIVPADELEGKYHASRSDAETLVAWLRAQGFAIDQVSSDSLSVFATGTIDQIERSLGVNMSRVTIRGMTTPAAVDVPGLPARVAGSVQHIGGLQPFLGPNKHAIAAPYAGMTGPAPAAAPYGYGTAHILAAYGAAGLNLNGSGEEIGILIDTLPLASDLVSFWQVNGVNQDATRVSLINVTNSPLPARTNEETLDASWTTGIADHAAVRVYAAGSMNWSALDFALDQIYRDVLSRPNLRQLSLSFGLNEQYVLQTAGIIDAQHQRYVKLAAAGVNIFLSSGDGGSNPGPDGHVPDGPLQPEYPASDPCVIAVGGTSLVLDANGGIVSETGWSGSGGGSSNHFPLPQWQSGVAAGGTQRTVPDVSLAADPTYGAYLVFNGVALPGGLGGTSWAAPVWAAFSALINQSRVAAGKPRSGLYNYVLYQLGPPALRDIAGGSNGQYKAAAGYDLVTGLGVPHLGNLIGALP